MSDEESLRKIVYSSSEDDFIDVNEENEHINLTRRISKMGKIEAKPNPAAKKRTKKQPSRREKEKENARERSQNKTSKRTSEVLTTAKGPLGNVNSTFMSSRRLTLGLSGVFGAVRKSDIVKRKGKKMDMNSFEIKTSSATKDRVNRDLERIINPPRKTHPVALEYEMDEDQHLDDQLSKPAFSVANDDQRRKSRLHDYRASSSTSSSGNISKEFITPITQLAAETPVREIGKVLKESLVISKHFPGRKYIDEIREELRKTYRQDLSLLDETSEESEKHCNESKIAPLSIMRSRINRSSDREEAAARGKVHTETQRFPAEERMSLHASEHENKARLSGQVEAHASKSGFTNPIHFQADTFYGRGNANMQQSTNYRANPSSFTILNCITEPMEDSNIRNPVLGDFVQPLESSRSVIVDDNLYHQRDCADHVRRSTNHYQQDSGTYSEEFSTQHKAGTHQAIPIDSSTSDYLGFDSFKPRRAGNRDNPLLSNKYVNDVNYSDRHDNDHDYHLAASNFDILHYAGEVEQAEEAPSMVLDEKPSSLLNKFSYNPVPKKPCLETPSPPMQLFRLKMF